MNTTRHGALDTPIGRLRFTSDGAGIITIRFPGDRGGTERASATSDAVLNEAARQLAEYFAGARRAFELPLRPTGTPFQLRVWSELQRIPYGETISYGELARRIGAPNAARAVGLANGANPIPIVIPCHRVIGSDGSLTGFGGGIATKRALLDLEQRATAAESLRLC